MDTLVYLVPRYEKVLLHEQSLLDELPKIKPKIKIRLRHAKSIKEIDKLIAKRPAWYYNLAEHRFQEKSRCYIAESNNEVIGCMWLEFNNYYLSNVEYNLELDNESVASIDGWVDPEYRGLNIFPFIRIEILKQLKAQGKYKRVIGLISSTNIASINVQKKLDLAKIFMTVSLIKVFGIRKHIVRNIDNLSFKDFC